MLATPLTIWWATPTDEAGALLTAAEREQAGRRRDPDDRARSATGRAVLRLACAAAFGCPPREVRFTVCCAECGGPHGKPEPVPPPDRVALHTSVSTARGLVLVAATPAGPVGVDVERADAVGFARFDDVALTDRERAALQRLPPTERAAARARAWVRKEAVLKRQGVGLARDPADVDVTDALDRSRGPATRAATVRLTDLGLTDLGPPLAGVDYRAAVATTGRGRPAVTVKDARAALVAAVAHARTATA